MMLNPPDPQYGDAEGIREKILGLDLFENSRGGKGSAQEVRPIAQSRGSATHPERLLICMAGSDCVISGSST
jgi:hypothetical protein